MRPRQAHQETKENKFTELEYLGLVVGQLGATLMTASRETHMLRAYIIERIENDRKAKDNSKAVPLRIQHPTAAQQDPARNVKKSRDAPAHDRGSVDIDFQL